MLKWGLRCQPPFLTRIYGKTSFSEKLMVFNIVKLRFNCFRVLLMGSHRLVHQFFVELEDAKSSFSMWICKRTACTEENFSCLAIKACLFSNVVYGHDILTRTRGRKPAFFEVNLGWKHLVKKLYLTLLDEQLNIFNFGNSAHSDLLSKLRLILRIKISFSRWFCERLTFSESCFVLRSVPLTNTCLQMWFLDSLKHLHQMFKGSRKIDSNFFVVKLPKEWSFQNYFCFRPCRNVYFYSSMVFCFKQSFY